MGVLGKGPLRPLAVAQILAGFADALVAVSLAGSLFFNLSPDASRTQVLLYLVITMVPFTVLAPLVGPAIDRFRSGHRFVAAGFYALRAVCALGLALTLFELTFYLFALALLVSSKASGVVRQALVPRLIDDPARLVSANSALARVGTIAAGFGGAAGSALLALTKTGQAPLAVAAAGFALAALAVLRLPAARAGAAAPAAVEYAELHTPSVVVAATGLMALRAGVGYFVFLLAFALRRANEPAWVYGAAVAVYGTGSFLANVVSPWLRKRLTEEWLMALALLIATMAATLGVIGINRRSLLVVSFSIGLAAIMGRQAFDSLLQRAAPDALRGRAFARYETRFQLTWVAGGLLATALVLPVEAGMVLLAALFVPVLALYIRGAVEAREFGPARESDDLAAALARFHSAESWQEQGNARHAVVDAVAAVDLAVVSGAAEPDAAVAARLDDLRHTALRHQAGNTEATEALDLAARVLGIKPVGPPTPPSTTDPRP
jgi:MFS family permease